jgi:Ran GTPase-activating protein (RanGAP) involved in mRNA processing and transport
LDSAGADLVQNLLKYNNLKILNLNKNFMGLKFAEQMKRVLKGGEKNLTELYLSWNEFSHKGVKILFEGIAEHAYLKVFDFSWNKIDEESAPLLGRSICHFT